MKNPFIKLYTWKIVWACSVNTGTSVTLILHTLSCTLAITISERCYKNYQDIIQRAQQERLFCWSNTLLSAKTF